MTRSIASAPGKLFLGGEYAVLEGGVAVVTTVDLRVTATTSDDRPSSSPVLEAVRREVETHLGARTANLPTVKADSDDLSRGRTKLGLGSSAAVAAAATGALFEWAGLPVGEHRDDALAVATRAHRAAQGQKGSGADVAACVLGGTIVFTPGATPLEVERVSTPHVIVWTGTPASTVDLVGAVKRLAARDAGTYGALMGDMKVIAERIADLFQSGSHGGLPKLYDRYGDLMARLGESAGADIVTQAHARARELAAKFKGGAKPSGAGGGDCAIAAFEDPQDAKRFADACRSEGLIIIDAKIHAEGLRRG